MGTRLTIPESRLPEIEAALSKEKDAKVVRWLFGIRLLALHHTPREIARQLDVSDRIVRNWVHRFLDGGIEAMQRQSSDGRPPLLTRDGEERFEERIRNGPTDTDAFATWRGSFVRGMLDREFGVSYGRSSVYVLLHRMGFSSLMPRAKHPDSSEEEQKRFQKKHSPKHSSASGSRSRANESSYGSRTKRVSANKAR
jgi:Transposase and inactivated derivatives